MDGKVELKSLYQDEVIDFVKKLGFPAYRGRQIFSWVQKKAVKDFSEMTDIKASDRDKLSEHAYLDTANIVKDEVSKKQDTEKLLLELIDGEKIELALMMYRRKNARDRATCCVSSQSGCPLACAFCATGLSGPGRNLTTGEIVSQVQLADQLAKDKGYQSITNIVYMGMGEPMLNLDNVKKSILLFNDKDGMNIGIRKITVSTAGIVPKIREMAEWRLQIGLAISLHAADQKIREKLMPVAKKYSLDELLNAASYYKELTGQRVTYEYALFDGVNDSPADAEKLGKLLKSHDCLVNIIPANLVKETGYFPSKVEKIKTFMDIAASFGLEVQKREERGSDINAACGQLRRR